MFIDDEEFLKHPNGKRRFRAYFLHHARGLWFGCAVSVGNDSEAAAGAIEVLRGGEAKTLAALAQQTHTAPDDWEGFYLGFTDDERAAAGLHGSSAAARMVMSCVFARDSGWTRAEHAAAAIARADAVMRNDDDADAAAR